ncbi:hypothetical protein O7A70_23820 [Mesorhizobium sp. Cs1299R1N1]|uniref:hypothetical protein n=1 Tax=Mesorhizobium sp. Cs1299R1N1 TaxID=3015172 RepID=UPI00301C7E9E
MLTATPSLRKAVTVLRASASAQWDDWRYDASCAFPGEFGRTQSQVPVAPIHWRIDERLLLGKASTTSNASDVGFLPTSMQVPALLFQVVAL